MRVFTFLLSFCELPRSIKESIKIGKDSRKSNILIKYSTLQYRITDTKV